MERPAKSIYHDDECEPHRCHDDDRVRECACVHGHAGNDDVPHHECACGASFPADLGFRRLHIVWVSLDCVCARGRVHGRARDHGRGRALLLSGNVLHLNGEFSFRLS